MGVLAHLCARLTVRSSPHQHERKLFRRTLMQSHLQTTFENTPLCLPKYSIVRGVGGSLDNFLNLESLFSP